ncbi:hypothetical protein BD779DRAFT_1510246 [Infundibulicybe gibba]|nr:hypothetical protein BD779DRAFT_1510246 [Infundibulicybe gibba]
MASTASMPVYMMPGVSVHQPPHLDGDAALATEILPGPPSLVSAQQSAQKRDPRKPSTIFSYLPASDPGSTYSGIMHGTLIGQELDGPRAKRSRIDKGSATGRAQRASARNQSGATSPLELHTSVESAPPPAAQSASLDSDSYLMITDGGLIATRSTSSTNPQEGTSVNLNGRPKRRDKGKAKEIDPPIRVKEEPKVISLHTPEPPFNLLNNEDHCSSCRSNGALVYCDGCPRAFHLWCLDPPMETVDEGEWFCPSCLIRKHPPRKPPQSLLSPLIHFVETTLPIEFQLPEDVRAFFKDVGTGPKGTYVDSSEIKQPRLNRHGQLEDRDAHRLKDRNGAPVLCFRCGTSALPEAVAAAAAATKRARRSLSYVSKNSETWKSIVSCDYCGLHWHLDCLDPPLITMPPFNKKWMCPNHAEQVLPPKRRIPKQNAPPIEINKPRQFNNGNIEVIQPQMSQIHQSVNGIAVDEVLINGRRYRVPERVIVLDFWGKLNKFGNSSSKDAEVPSGMSSPLTSLSSLDDLEERMLPDMPHNSMDELRVAQILTNLQLSKSTQLSNRLRRITTEAAIQTEADPQLSTPKTAKAPWQPRVIRPPANNPQLAAVVSAPIKTPSDAATPSTRPASRLRRRKSSQVLPPKSHSTRELRSRSKNNDSSLTSLSSSGSYRRIDNSSEDSLLVDNTIATSSSGRSRPANIKREDIDTISALNGLGQNGGGPVPAPINKPTPKRTRSGRRTIIREVEPNTKEEGEKRSRKRKERDDDALTEGTMQQPQRTNVGEKPDIDRKEKEKKDKPGKEKVERTKKLTRTPVRANANYPPSTNTTTSSMPSPPPPTTPSLKIRLPRLSHLHAQATSPSISTTMPSANAGTPTRL